MFKRPVGVVVLLRFKKVTINDVQIFYRG
jgi:hypothetical protein